MNGDEYPTCETCGGSMTWEDCWQVGCDDGEITNLHEIDPLYYDPNDTEVCEWCEGNSGWWVCISRHPEEAAS